MDESLFIRRVRRDDDLHLAEPYRLLDLDARCRRFVGSTLPGPCSAPTSRPCPSGAGPASWSWRSECPVTTQNSSPKPVTSCSRTATASWRSGSRPRGRDASRICSSRCSTPPRLPACRTWKPTLLVVDHALGELLRSRGAVVMAREGWHVCASSSARVDAAHACWRARVRPGQLPSEELSAGSIESARQLVRGTTRGAAVGLGHCSTSAISTGAARGRRRRARRGRRDFVGVGRP